MVSTAVLVVIAIVATLLLVAGILLIVFGARGRSSGRVAIGSVLLSFGLGGIILGIFLGMS